MSSIKKNAPTKSHKNRKSHNWLAYKIGDEFLYRFSSLVNGVVYDLGCGDTFLKDWLLLFGTEYVGVDWDGSIHEKHADIFADLNENIPVNDEEADTIISISVMEHLHAPQKMLNEANRILKPGGSIILQVPFMWWVHEAPNDFYRYTNFAIEKMLSEAGFEKIEIYAQSGLFCTTALKINYQLNRLVRGPSYVRWLSKSILTPIWFSFQIIGLTLDNLIDSENETIGYFAIAMKPKKCH